MTLFSICILFDIKQANSHRGLSEVIILDIREIQAIDVHSHFGEWNYKTGYGDHFALYNGDVDYLLQNMKSAGIGFSINSHLYSFFPRGGGDSFKGNQMGLSIIEKNPNLYLWAVVNPLQPETFAQAKEVLEHERCLGIKVHPEEHRYPLKTYGEALYEFAAKHHAVIEGHSGEEWSLPEDYNEFANHFPEVTTIASHLGCGFDGDFRHQIRAIQNNVHHNLFTDTSSAKSINCNILEIAVSEIGSDRILFGTDSGCYFSPSQRARVDHARISDADKENILFRNTLGIFPQLKKRHDEINEKTDGYHCGKKDRDD
jgi:predicted TIM-barrel fold metal-dependent hydrolase